MASFTEAMMWSLARQQLSLSHDADVPPLYLVQLMEHVQVYPHDINFSVLLQPGRGYGRVTCREQGCSPQSISLSKNEEIFDGGLSDGFGSFLNYQAHIIASHSHLSPHRGQRPIAPMPTTSPMAGSSSPVLAKASRSFTDRLLSASTSSTSNVPRKRPSQECVQADANKRIKAEPFEPKVFIKQESTSGAGPPSRIPLTDRNEVKLENMMQTFSQHVATPTPAAASTAQRRLRDMEKELQALEHDLAMLVYHSGDSPRKATPKVAAHESRIRNLKSGIAAQRRLAGGFSGSPVKAEPLPSATGGPSRGTAAVNVKEENKHTISSFKTDPGVPRISLGSTFASGSGRRLSFKPEPDIDNSIFDDDEDDAGLALPLAEFLPGNPQKEFDAFITAAGNAEIFESSADITSALRKLRMKDINSQNFHNMTITLLPHQALGVAWMVDQEHSNHQGGILADEMGLGKTVQMIATISFNPSASPKRKTTLIVTPVSLLRQWKAEIETKSSKTLKIKIYHGSSRARTVGELLSQDIVLTTFGTLASEWPEDVEQLLKRRRKSKKQEDDWIVEESDDAGRKKPKGPKTKGLLFLVPWYRVVLDEAQNIRNKQTRVSRALSNLDSDLRWCLTGTPIMNTLADAYGLLRFLKIRPWYEWNDFRTHIMKYERKNTDLAVTRLQAIFRVCLLRRRKDSKLDGQRLIELPDKTYHLDELTFCEEEQRIYNMIQDRSRVVFNRYLRQGTVLKNYAHVLAMLLRLRQCCVHPSLIANFEDAFLKPGEVRPSGEITEDHVPPAVPPALDERARATLILGTVWVSDVLAWLKQKACDDIAAERASKDASIPDECPICFETVGADAVITPCKHIFCYGCIENVLNTARPPEPAAADQMPADHRPCPNCRFALSKTQIFQRSAFMPTDAEVGIKDEKDLPPLPTLQDIFEMANVDAPKSSKKARPLRSRTGQSRVIVEDSDDSMDDFIVGSDESETEKDMARARRAKKGKGKQKMRIVDSDSEYEGESSEAEEVDDENDDGEIIAFRKKAKGKRKRTNRAQFLPSTKMLKMMELLKSVRESHPGDKTMIVSQWTGVLELCESYLEENNFKYVSYRGDMSATLRDDAVHKFMFDDSYTVMLMSCKAGGVGLNLTRANRVISLDFAWSVAVEGQAFDRTHRLGQKKNVEINRLAIKNTVEAKILDLQAKKQNLADGSLGENKQRKLGRLSVRELANLFGLNTRGEVIG